MTKLIAPAILVMALTSTSAHANSAFGCSGLETNRELPTIEGKDGVFFRINADLRMNHPFSPEVVEQLATLSRALERRGTTLIYAPIPTKSVSMPSYLPDRARLYGFDLEVATSVHNDVLDRLTQAGVVNVDIRQALLTAEAGQLPFFNSDFHWSAYGANLGAAAIAEVIKQQPIYDALPKTPYKSTQIAEEVAFSGMRRILQMHCTETLPEPTTLTWETVADLGDTSEDFVLDIGLGDEPLDIGLGDDAIDIGLEEDVGLPIALVGTSFSDSPINNFPNWIAQHSSLEVVNFAITGGNQFGAITSYLTSTDFQEAPPAFLVWENPIYNNLAQFGDQPLRELIAAASGNCDRTLDLTISPDGHSLTANIAGLGDAETLFLDSNGSSALELDYTFLSAGGDQRVKSLRRGERLRQTGRFYMPLTGLWPDGAQDVQITLSAPLGKDPSLSVCSPIQQKEKKS